MSSVTGRIKEVKQPRGGYIKPSEFKAIVLDDGKSLNENENVHGIIVGLAVDYLTRFILGTNISDAFHVSMNGAKMAESMGFKKAKSIAEKLIASIKGFDDTSIINACKLVTFDVWIRNSEGAIMAKRYDDINPDRDTVENMHILIERSLAFFKEYGPVVKDGFTFEPANESDSSFGDMMMTGKGSWGGYTFTVDSGDGDFLTSDTLWDFKVSKTKPTSKHTLQLLMYWIMGLHSEQEVYKNITKLGIFNPRLNMVYLFDTKNVSEEIIDVIESEVICYR